MAAATDNDIFAQQRQPILTERGTFVPPWYVPHKDTSTVVIGEDGKPMPFTVGDVAPERRWAIREDGTLMDKQEFAELYEKWLNGQWTWLTPPEQPRSTEYSAKPNPEKFVAKQVDPGRPNRLADLPMPHRSRHAPSLPSSREGIVSDEVSRGGAWRPAPKEEKE